MKPDVPLHLAPVGDGRGTGGALGCLHPTYTVPADQWSIISKSCIENTKGLCLTPSQPVKTNISSLAQHFQCFSSF